ncbi:hypothetical protein AX15_005298 [Amanita polypyramis BW_CC]|nr:hypothetical protein AX15_005298 [Amanita polypyramis BW_CC]
MPASTSRKSSIGDARRGIQKAHIPYRGDNPAVGKKTGIAVRNVERMSDGFEPFEEVMQQADKRTPPPLAKARRKKKSVVVEDEEPDENGEMSMELDNSPMPYYTSARRAATPTNISRVLSTSRLVALTPETDFDKVPSPRSRSVGRKSVGRLGAGPSRLSMASTIRHSSPDHDAIDEALHNEVDTNDISHLHYSLPRSSPLHTSFVQMDQDDDEGNEPFQEPFMSDIPVAPEEEESPVKIAKNKKDKGKAREAQKHRDGKTTVPDNRHEEPEEEELRPDPDPKLKRGKNRALHDDTNTTSERPRKRTRKENRPQREGTRRSVRDHIKPLEWWRGERYIYGRGESKGPILVPPVKEIMRIPKEPVVPLGTKRKRSSARGRSKSKAIEQPPVMYNPEEGWDDSTSDTCVVLDYPSGKEKLRQIGFTASMYDPKMAANNEWKYQRIFGDNEFIAAGQLSIPVAGRKPSKTSKDNTYIFYVAEGAVNFKVHDTSLVLATGGMVMVPRGNTYYIENIADREAKLVFTQARKLAPTEEEISHQKMVNNRRSIDSGGLQ